MGEHIASGKVLPWRTNHRHLKIEDAPRPPKYDLVFIDGGHNYSDAFRDIQFAISVVESGGTICGHDYDIGSPGVVQATQELFSHVNRFQNTRMWFAVLP